MSPLTIGVPAINYCLCEYSTQMFCTDDLTVVQNLLVIQESKNMTNMIPYFTLIFDLISDFLYKGNHPLLDIKGTLMQIGKSANIFVFI